MSETDELSTISVYECNECGKIYKSRAISAFKKHLADHAALTKKNKLISDEHNTRNAILNKLNDIRLDVKSFDELRKAILDACSTYIYPNFEFVFFLQKWMQIKNCKE